MAINLNQIPLYQSHKQVRGLKITKIDYHADYALVHVEGIGGREFPSIPVELAKIAQTRPEPGWYVVYYLDNNYFSFSPGDVFENNHTLISQ